MNNKQPEPFIKWAGGKRQLLDTIDYFLPSIVKNGNFNYIEPFVGGGAVFFHIINKYNFSSSVIIDDNRDLILLYQTIKSKVTDLIKELKTIENEYYLLSEDERRDFFYDKRNQYNFELESVDYDIVTDISIRHSANFIFLNRTCFNGLYRVNKAGKFNVPFGRYKKPTICNENNLGAVSTALQNTQIINGDFKVGADFVGDNTFIYFDPPYRPLSTSSNFTSYSKSGFNDVEQTRLANFYRNLNQDHDVCLMLSNSDPKNIDTNDNFFDDLYKGFHIHRVSASRMINSKQSGRGKISELLILNYETQEKQISHW